MRIAREGLGLTQKQLGALVKVTSHTIAMIERGKQSVRWRVLEGLIKALHQSPSYFFSDEAPRIVQPEITPEQALEVIRRSVFPNSSENSPSQPHITSLSERERQPLDPRVRDLIPRLATLDDTKLRALLTYLEGIDPTHGSSQTQPEKKDKKPAG